VPPAYAYALLKALNSFLNDRRYIVSWRVVDGRLQDAPTWKQAGLTRRILEEQQWLGSGEQLARTVKMFVSRGQLSRSKDGKELSITTSLMTTLLRHAQDYYLHIFGNPAPANWSLEKGDWLAFNEIVFKFIFDDVGPAWRQVRSEVNRVLSKKEPGDQYITDHMANHPAYWLVILIVGFRGGLADWKVYQEAVALKFNDYVKSSGDVSRAIDVLCKFGVLLKENNHLMLASNFELLMINVFRSIEASLPQFQSKCQEWRGVISTS
jgi:hypothetical protein